MAANIPESVCTAGSVPFFAFPLLILPFPGIGKIAAAEGINLFVERGDLALDFCNVLVHLHVSFLKIYRPGR